jgi:hypothetical protein
MLDPLVILCPFTEGAETTDLIDARTLLDSLNRSLEGRVPASQKELRAVGFFVLLLLPTAHPIVVNLPGVSLRRRHRPLAFL